MLLDRAAAAADDGVHNIIYYYNDSKTHSKMDINYRGFSFPPPYIPLPADGSRGPFEHFDVRAEFVKPEGGGVYFNPRKKKEHNHTRNTLYAYI